MTFYIEEGNETASKRQKKPEITADKDSLQVEGEG